MCEGVVVGAGAGAGALLLLPEGASAACAVRGGDSVVMSAGPISCAVRILRHVSDRTALVVFDARFPPDRDVPSVRDGVLIYRDRLGSGVGGNAAKLREGALVA